MTAIEDIFISYGDYASEFFLSMTNPESRLFLGFLFTSFIVAYILYLRRSRGTGFFRFLFPKSVWDHPTAWLDVRYFFFHSLFGKFFVAILTGTAFAFGVQYGIGGAQNIDILQAAGPESPVLRASLAIAAFIVLLLASDFSAFLIHYMQHKIPFLWQFHKVHHCGEVMHPLSNFREHPIDNFTYGLLGGLFAGFAFGLLIGALGYRPTVPKIIGYSIAGLAFNSAAYSLRHSHIWLKWPGVWSKVFGSPAHHHIHHSRHPDHLDKNFAFMLPIWDVLFKTYEMPEDNRDVEFGIVEDSSDLNSCLNLYLIPFRDAYRVLKSGKKADPAFPVETETIP